MHDAAEIFYMALLATLIFFALTATIIIVMRRYYARKRSQELSLVQFDQAHLQSRFEIKEQTFKTISEDLEENIGQDLALAKLNLNSLQFNDRVDAKEKVNGAIDILSQSIQSMRDLSKSLHTEIIQRNGLINALENETDLIRRLGVIGTTFHISGVPVDIDDGKSLIIFRILQEALHNANRHSGATDLELTMQYSATVITVSVRDDGSGFSNADLSAHDGLRNMKDRAAIIGADFSVSSTPGNGTVVMLTIPI